MRINDQNLSGISSSQLGRTQENEAGARHGRSAGTGAAGGDRVQLSDLAGSLRTLSSGTPERTAYLEKLSADVEARRYSVDAQALSKRLVGDSLERRD